MPLEMPATYNPQAIERPLYDWWRARGDFRPRPDPEQTPFVISMPPPNVTGALHLGHAIVAAIEDALIRHHRMAGRPTLWVPGTDHAGIATQAVVEREIAKEGITRHDLGRESFIERVWEWKEVYHKRITEQHYALGISCDWDRERFTMDEGLSRAVREAFVRLYEDGLIYRGEYLINWCPRCGTALSDLEVEHEPADSHLWYVRYWTEEGDASITVATTRPETILGDTAVAVHPEDERYAALIGRRLRLPLLGRLIPVVGDEAVDREFGTGAVKVTPAHDPVDNAIAQRHGLALINVMNDNMTMNAAAGRYEGQDRFACRENIVADLQAAGDLVRIEPYSHSVGHCQRCATIVEPRISTQWFVRANVLAEPAIEAVRDGRIRIVPERFTRIYYNWMENIHDWCISRQLWWGHRIPVWYCDGCGEMIVAREDPTHCPKCGGSGLSQDPDVLDTWFSSGLWPFSTLGWPDQTDDLRTYYPTSVLETAYDIIFFWVARMIMMGLYFTGEAPFQTVYLHGLVRNEDGVKISKSMEDAWRYDPLFIIKEYGLDPLRFTLLTGSTPGNDMKLAESRIEANRNFCNKIWQATRYVLANLGTVPQSYAADGSALDPAGLGDDADRWIVSRYHEVAEDVTRLIEGYQLGEAGRQIYEFLWGEYCDWYIEMTKPRLRGSDPESAEAARRVLVYVLDGALRLLHPYMPFVTEALWQYLPHQGEALIVAAWPASDAARDADAVQRLDGLMDLTRAIRNARTEHEVDPGRRIAAIVAGGDQASFLQQQSTVLASLARVDENRLEIVGQLQKRPEKALALVTPQYEVFLPLEALLDLDRERQRLGRELEAVGQELDRVTALLANERFTARAPEAVVAKEREKLLAYGEQRARLEARLAELS
ncbi:MAG: valine--tRNA ligase [Chloroflexi bacterium]|nr:valine--tRNA ligase [Chloroflexota bacterium]